MPLLSILMHNPGLTILSFATLGSNYSYQLNAMEKTRPEIALLVHYENFFRPLDKPLKTVPKARVEQNFREIRQKAPVGTTVLMPKPLSHFSLVK